MENKFLTNLVDKKYLPIWKDVVNNRREIGNAIRNGYDNLNGDQVFDSIWYEFVTYELVDGLTKHIFSRFDKCPSILEVCAGNGRLAKHLSQFLYTYYGSYPRYIATSLNNQDLDSCIWDNVEEIDQYEAVKKYQPQIIIGSWLHKGPDPTKKRRKDSWLLKEYILIGPPSDTANLEETFWIEEYGGGLIENPTYEQDGFSKVKLPISTLNPTFCLWLKWGPTESEVYSFQKSN